MPCLAGGDNAPPMSYAALLTDLDGTLVDSEPRHFEAHRRFLRTVGIAVTEADLHGNIGRGDVLFYRDLMAAHGKTGDPDAWVAAKTDVLIGIYRDEGLPLGRGGRTLVDWVVGHGLPRMVVTSSERRLCVAALTAAGVDRIFHSRVVREETPAHKPDPSPYLLAAARLGVPPSSCLVVEDSEAGVRSGVAAGCRVVGCFGLVPAVRLQAAGAHHLVDDLAEVVRILERA